MATHFTSTFWANSFLKNALIRFVLPFLILGALCACHKSPVVKKNLIDPPTPKKDLWVPHWYAEFPRVPGCQLAYAYSGIYINADRQKQALLQSGAANLAKNKRIELEVGWAGSRQGIYTRTAAYIKENGWESRAEIFEKDMKILKKFRLDQSMLALVGLCPGYENTDDLSAALGDKLVNIATQIPPDWVREPLQGSGQVFGVGSAAGRTTAAKAWKEAERQARADLAFRLAGNTQILEKNMLHNYFGSEQLITESEAKLTLQNAQVIRHAYSHSDQTYYALVRMPFAAAR